MGMNNIMDAVFNGMGGSEFYRAQVFPELFPHEKPMLINNWTENDREMYCGVAHTPCLGVSNRKSDLSSSEAGKEVN